MRISFRFGRDGRILFKENKFFLLETSHQTTAQFQEKLTEKLN